ncbi:hypothetical protein ACFL35_13845 [Candidatus Riflebacteria bacterium]
MVENNGMLDWRKFNVSQKNAYLKIRYLADFEEIFMPYLREILCEHKIINSMKSLNHSEANNVYEFCESDDSMVFMKVGNFLRFGSEIEFFFQEYFMEKQNITDEKDLKEHLKSLNPGYSGNIFYRVLPGNNPGIKTLMELYQTELKINLYSYPEFAAVQEYYIHRHFFTHRTGIVDRKYLKNIEFVLGKKKRKEIESSIAKKSANKKYNTARVLWFGPVEGKDYFNILNRTCQLILSLPK